MKASRYKKACALLLAGALTAGTAVPAFAAVTVAEKKPVDAPMTLAEIQEEVLRNNRLKSTLELNYKKVEAGLSAIDDGLDELRDTQDDAAHSRKQAGQSAGLGQAGIGKITAGVTELNKLAASGAFGDLSGTVGGISGALGGLAEIESGLLSGASKTAGAMEKMVDSISEQQRDTLEDQQTSLKNTKLDLNKTQQDWKNEALLVTQLLVTKTAQVETGISLLTEKQALLERVCEIEEKKTELGFSVPVDLEGKKLEVSQGAKDIQDASDGLTLLKRQLNDLMGRDLDETLVITAPEFTREIAAAPE